MTSTPALPTSWIYSSFWADAGRYETRFWCATCYIPEGLSEDYAFQYLNNSD